MPRLEVMPIGREGLAAVAVDEFAGDPDALRAAAAQAEFAPAHHAYPGIRAELPTSYWPSVAPLIAQAAAAIGVRGEGRLIDASFSIVTTPRDALSLAQQLPHADSRDDGRIAFVHYLDSSEASGGTAFFRHRSTKFEYVDRERGDIFDGQLDAELRRGGPPPRGYVGAEDRLFERIAALPPVYNRALVYRSFALHSGVIPDEAPLSANPLAGRLTVTGFLAFG